MFDSGIPGLPRLIALRGLGRFFAFAFFAICYLLGLLAFQAELMPDCLFVVGSSRYLYGCLQLPAYSFHAQSPGFGLTPFIRSWADSGKALQLCNRSRTSILSDFPQPRPSLQNSPESGFPPESIAQSAVLIAFSDLMLTPEIISRKVSSRASVFTQENLE